MIITTAIALKLARGLFLDPQPSSSPATPTAAQAPPAAEAPAAASTSQEAPTEPKKPAKDTDSDGDQDSIPYVSASDCNACPTPCQDQDHPHYPSYLKIDQETPLLNSTRTYTRHVLISTGQEDWEASIYDDKDSLAPHLQKAIDDGQERLKQANGGKDLPRIVLTNSSRVCEHWGGPGWQVIVLPDHIVVNNVTPEQCDDFFEAFLKPSVGSTVAPGTAVGSMTTSALAVEKDLGQESRPQLGKKLCSTTTSSSSSSSSSVTATATSNPNSIPNPSLAQDGRTSLSAAYSSSHTTITTTTISTTDSISLEHELKDEREQELKDKHLQSHGSAPPIQQQQQQQQHHHRHHHHAPDQTREVTAGKTTFIAHRWQPAAALMICSHKKRDKRCGVTAAILKKEFTRILRSKDIYGDGEGDVEIWLISHIGGHKFAGNVIVHKSNGLAVWYGRVEPCHADAIVETTLEKGQVIKELYRGSMMGSFDPHHKKTAW
ncbi:unnamed protein product [Mortierella alpina]